MKGSSWNMAKTNAHRSSAYLFEIYPKKVQRKALDLGTKVELVDQIVACFYDIYDICLLYMGDIDILMKYGEDRQPLSQLSLGYKILQEG